MSVPVTNVTLEAESIAIGYLYVAFAMMIFYDYALGIDEEVELFWHMPFLQGPTWIFLANRYSLLVTYKIWRQGLRGGKSSPLIILILRDGLLYFATILVLNILELVVMRAWVKASSANVAYTSYVVVP
ncbi:hypothetical protein FOMPIDRAFT_1051965 [Fomitopsis schrenkii]|uniref:DUF6533 domain-containing protein n=1 Tax=Fomitopsis schrenkii TaxID=2126942 RepID=S8DXX6_FOMSC|nr:hypothetical protein FOMPIDRAFT_1051965 [Fomitopsis schrenkii]